jgi:hypothetical protein
VESRLIKTKIEDQFAHKFWLEVASNSLALWIHLTQKNARHTVEDSRGEKRITPMVLYLLVIDCILELGPQSHSPLSKLSLRTLKHNEWVIQDICPTLKNAEICWQRLKRWKTWHSHGFVFTLVWLGCGATT